jgi:3'(2'), 5'-bisphosphate nucleotidase
VEYNLEDAKKLLSIAEAAGELILEIYHGSNDVEVQYKEDHSPLTEADLASHHFISENLNKLYPQIPILSEESSEISFQERKCWESLFLVDPLDGTKEFIKRNGQFTVNIALVHRGKPVIGILHAPVLKKSYYSVKGYGAYLVQDGLHTRMNPKKNRVHLLQNFKITPGQVIKIVASRSHKNKETADFIASLSEQGADVEMISVGSALKFGLIAEDLADVYPRYAPTMEWDTAAGQCIVEECGMVLLDMESKAPMVYNRENLTNNWFIVC